MGLEVGCLALWVDQMQALIQMRALILAVEVALTLGLDQHDFEMCYQQYQPQIPVLP